jgi:hypothetical protein
MIGDNPAIASAAKQSNGIFRQPRIAAAGIAAKLLAGALVHSHGS